MRHSPRTDGTRHPLAPSRLCAESLEDRCTPAAMLTITGATVVEGNDGSQNAVVRVNLTEPHGNAVTVDYRTAASSATEGGDYSAVSGKLKFARGVTEKSILIPVHGDRIGENDESFLVQLSGAKGAKIASGQASVTIQDDEPRVSVTGGWAYEGADGTTLVDFTVNLTRTGGETVTVDFATADSTAIAGEDYVSALGELTFGPDDATTRTITVAVMGDVTPEGDEYFLLNYTVTSNNALLQSQSAYGTIYEDDGYYDYYYDYGYYDYGYYDYGYYWY